MYSFRNKPSDMRLFTVFIAILCLSTSVRASINPYDVVMATDPTSRTSVIRSTVPMGLDTKLELVTPRGVRYYDREITEGEFITLRFPANYLPTGKYVLRIFTERGRTSLPFEYRKRAIGYTPAEGLQTIYPGVDLRDDRRLIVSYPANEGSPLRVTLLNYAGEAVFTDRDNAGAATRKAYQLDNLSAGVYTLTIATEDMRLHSHELQLK